MKKFAFLLLLPLLAGASTPPYAKRWPLILAAGDGGAYRVTLSREVYATATRADLRDVAIIDADGQEVAAALLGPQAAEARPIARVPVPWFPLPATAAVGIEAGTALRMNASVGDNGRILQLQASTTAPVQAKSDAHGFLVDLSHVREGVQALEIHWPAGAAREAHYRVESSIDLQHWQTVHVRSTLLELQRDGEHLLQNEIAIPGGLRYLRLLPLDAGATLPVTTMRVRLDTQYIEQRRSWVALPGRRISEKSGDAFLYQSDGRYPVAQADLASDAAMLGQWTLDSRDAPDAPWQYRTGPWVAWQVGGAERSASPAQDLVAAPARDRYWRLHGTGPLPANAPRLKLGYRPEVMVFLAQGKPPYALVAGSARAVRTQAPIAALVQALRNQRGNDWQPTPAYLGVSATLSGNAALQPVSPQRDWKTWLLWALLVGGAALVAGFALSLLKRPAAAD